MNVLSKRLKAMRMKRGLTQRQMATKLNISPSSIALYETGGRNPDPDMLRRLADFLGCSTDYLLGRTDDPDPYPFNEAEAEEAFQKAIAAMKKKPHDKEYAMKRIREFIQIALPEFTGKTLTQAEYNIIMANIKAVLEAQEEK